MPANPLPDTQPLHTCRRSRRSRRLGPCRSSYRTCSRCAGSAPRVLPDGRRVPNARVPELGHVTRRHAARLCAVAPADRQSGKSRRRARIDGGRDRLRPILHMVALAAMRSNPIIKAFANRLTIAGKPKRLVIAACARKIIAILNAMLRDQTMWQHAKAA